MQNKGLRLINPEKNDPGTGPGDPYPFEGKTNPYLDMLKKRGFDMTAAGQSQELYAGS